MQRGRKAPYGGPVCCHGVVQLAQSPGGGLCGEYRGRPAAVVQVPAGAQVEEGLETIATRGESSGECW